jgi:phage-related protein
MSEFTAVPDKVLDEKLNYKTLVSNFENGVEQRRNKWSIPLREFVLTFENRTQDEMETVRDFFIAKLGSYTSFTWTNINDDVEYTVRFKEDSFGFKRKAYEIYDFDLALIEVK